MRSYIPPKTTQASCDLLHTWWTEVWCGFMYINKALANLQVRRWSPEGFNQLVWFRSPNCYCSPFFFLSISIKSFLCPFFLYEAWVDSAVEDVPLKKHWFNWFGYNRELDRRQQFPVHRLWPTLCSCLAMLSSDSDSRKFLAPTKRRPRSSSSSRALKQQERSSSNRRTPWNCCNSGKERV